MKLKLTTLTYLLAMCITHVTSLASAGPKILAETIRTVGYAPPEYVGNYRFQILSDGNVVSIDNKNTSKYLGILNSDLIKKLKETISEIPGNLTLKRPIGQPECMDAPSSITVIYKNNAQSILIAENYNCISSINPHAKAESLAHWIYNLKNALIDPSGALIVAEMLTGQEGYGAPADPEPITPKPRAVCISEKDSTNPGTVYNVELIKDSYGHLRHTLILKKDVRGHVTKNRFQVVEKTNQPVGSPLLFEGNNVKLSIQYTTTPRPDGMHPGTLLLLNSAGREPFEIKLLCQ